MKIKYLVAITAFFSTSAFAQVSSQATLQTQTLASSPSFHEAFISRTVRAVNYEHRNGATKVDFIGTSLMPAASGHAKVESRRGAMGIGAEFADLSKPTAFGNEYLTYILWAISPEGRAVNLGEVLVGNNNRSKLDVTTDLQSFALIVTAEPYYAVTQPSNVVVLENVVRDNTKGTTEAVDAKYELMERGGYLPTGYRFDPVIIHEDLPLEFFEARNAVRIAQSEGADQYAGESYQHAVQLMNTADQYAIAKPVDKKSLIATSKEVVQTAEDARAISVKKIDAMRLAQEKQASADAQAASQAQTEEALHQKEMAQMAAAQAQDQIAANQAVSTAAINAAQSDAEQARLAAHHAEDDKAALRLRLSEQLNSILQTRDTARGLIVSMSDVLFGTGKFALMPETREKLAKVAGILLAYPSLNIEVGGYTDNVGSEPLNQRLSENRATSVRDYLVQEGVAAASVSAKGFGDTLPVASNDSSTGRQQNRRVELLVSGEAIGSTANVTVGSVR